MGKGKKRTSLKAALSSQQSRLRKKQEAVHALRLSEQKGKKKPRTNNSTPCSPVIPYSATDKILLVGEGNFSFTRSLVEEPPAALQYLPAENVTATAYDNEEDCYAKYAGADAIVAGLRQRGVQVIFEVDATKLEKCQALRGRKFDKVVWNFPHAGKGITDQDRNILSNQILLLGFLRSTSGFLTSGPIPQVQSTKGKPKQVDDEGEEESIGRNTSQVVSARGRVLVTLRNVPPYTLWDLPRLAKKPPPPQSSGEPTNPVYMQLRSFTFHRTCWKGYEHRMTKGERDHGAGKTGQGGEDRTWEFCLGSQRLKGQ